MSQGTKKLEALVGLELDTEYRFVEDWVLRENNAKNTNVLNAQMSVKRISTEYSNVVAVVMSLPVEHIIPLRRTKNGQLQMCILWSEIRYGLESFGLTCRHCGEKIFYK